MLIGSFFKNRTVALIAAFCYIYFALVERAFFYDLGSFFSSVSNLDRINPYFLYTSAFSPID